MRFISFICILFLFAGCNGSQNVQTSPDPESVLIAQLIDEAPQGVLPATPFPTHYQLDLKLDPRQARFSGTVTLTLSFTKQARGFYLHGRDLDVTAVRIHRPGEPVQAGQWIDMLPSGVAWIDFGQVVRPGELSVSVDYSAPFDVNLSGLFKVREQGDAYALAKSESIQARRFMPGFDQPAFKAPFDISLIIPETDLAISNAPVASSEPMPDGLKKIIFETTRPLPTYLLSLAVGSFDQVDAGFMPPNSVRTYPVALKGYARRGKGEALGLALETAPHLVNFFENSLQQPYPYKKLDIVAAPQWPSGATELAAAITYRESRILAGPDIGPAARRSLLALHAHEIGHMWFGNLVTPPWWDDLWLKEAFASWGEGASLSELYPGEGYELDAIQDGLRAMSLDSLVTARSVREPIVRNENVRNAYDAITYNKGLAVIGMVDAYFGSDLFRPALGEYVRAFEDGVADSGQFFDMISKVTGEPDLTRAFRSFIEQNGLPLLRIETYGKDRWGIQIRQSRYAPPGSRPGADRRWTIPFCMKLRLQNNQDERVCIMLDEDVTDWQAPQTLSHDQLISVLPNADGVGYWRFAMPLPLWQALAVSFDRLKPGEQLSVLDSAGAGFTAGQMPPELIWTFIRKAAQNPEYRVVQAALREAGRFEKWVHEDPAALQAYRQMISEIFRPGWQALEQTNPEYPAQKILKTQLEQALIRLARDSSLRADLAQAAAAYIGLPDHASDRILSSDEFNLAMSVGLQTYGRPFLDQMLIALTTIDDPVFGLSVAHALGENIDPEITGEILDLAYSGALGPRESYMVIRGQMRQAETQDMSWSRIQSDFPALLEVLPRQRRRASPALASDLCSSEALEQLQALFSRYGARVEGHERALRQTSERIELCIAGQNALAQPVQTFFLSLE